MAIAAAARVDAPEGCRPRWLPRLRPSARRPRSEISTQDALLFDCLELVRALLHEGGFTIEKDYADRWFFRLPDGRAVPDCGYRPEDTTDDGMEAASEYFDRYASAGGLEATRSLTKPCCSESRTSAETSRTSAETSRPPAETSRPQRRPPAPPRRHLAPSGKLLASPRRLLVPRPKRLVPQRKRRWCGSRRVKISELLDNSAIIRNPLKINAAVENARAFLRVREEFGTFDEYIWDFVDGKPLQNAWKTFEELPAKTELAETISKDLKKRGFRFVGPTIVYAHMQATGMVNDHTTDCFRYREIRDPSLADDGA